MSRIKKQIKYIKIDIIKVIIRNWGKRRYEKSGKDNGKV